MKLIDFIGQKHLLGKQGPITKIIENKKMYSFIFYGPPGIGKTTLANIIIEQLDYPFFLRNGATIKLEELREIIKTSQLNGPPIILLDEVHRLDKRIQNFLLPYLENGQIFLIGTTTENPFFVLNAALRSRLLLFNFKPIFKDDLIDGLKKNNLLLFKNKILSSEILLTIYNISNGDVRMSLNIQNFILTNYTLDEISSKFLYELFEPNFIYDKNESNHYDLLSAFQKSIRASDVNASMHYLARLLRSGDISSLLRRLIVIAYEDIGLGNPNACSRTTIAVQAFEQVGLPAGELILAQVVVDLCLSPKSTSSYQALNMAKTDLTTSFVDQIPSYLLYNQPHKTLYDRNVVKYLDNLPNNLKGHEYFISQNSSTYERQLAINYKTHQDGVKNYGKKK